MKTKKQERFSQIIQYITDPETGVVDLTKHPEFVMRDIYQNGILLNETHYTFLQLLEFRQEGKIVPFEAFVDVLINKYGITNRWLRKRVYDKFGSMIEEEFDKKK